MKTVIPKDFLDRIDFGKVAKYAAYILDLKKKGIGVLITDHNVDETLSITDRAYLMYSGQLLKTGTPEELVNDEEVRRVYLGENFVLKDRF